MSATPITFPTDRIVQRPRRKMSRKPQPKPPTIIKLSAAQGSYAALILLLRALAALVAPALYVLAGAGVLRLLGL